MTWQRIKKCHQRQLITKPRHRYMWEFDLVRRLARHIIHTTIVIHLQCATICCHILDTSYVDVNTHTSFSLYALFQVGRSSVVSFRHIWSLYSWADPPSSCSLHCKLQDLSKANILFKYFTLIACHSLLGLFRSILQSWDYGEVQN